MPYDQNRHREVLIRILQDIFSDSSLAPFLALKGGTAAMLFHELPRFSTDLDFDLLDLSKEEQVFAGVKKIVEKYGEMKKADNKRYTLFFLLSYHGKLDGGYNIKVEISKRDFGARYQVLSFMGIPMRVMVKEDMVAHKMLAMLHRIGVANRDIFDVWFFLKNFWQVNKEAIEKREGVAYNVFLQNAIDTLESYDDKQILSGLGDLLTEKQRRWVQGNIKKEALFYLRLALRNEKEFFGSFE